MLPESVRMDLRKAAKGIVCTLPKLKSRSLVSSLPQFVQKPGGRTAVGVNPCKKALLVLALSRLFNAVTCLQELRSLDLSEAGAIRFFS